MRVVVERSDLVSHGACVEGVELFDTLAPSGTWSGEWTALHVAWLARDYGDMYLWCVVRDILPSFPRDADLRDADLTGTNLTGADLTDANLRGAGLRRAYLRDAVLRYADLRGAVLSGAVLSGAVLSGAIFGSTYMPDGTMR